MQGSIERVRAIIHGRTPDRPALYELLRNDAVISHFAGETLTIENSPEVIFRAFAPAVDATRPRVRLPQREQTCQLPDGRRQRWYRWTEWTEPKVYADSTAYATVKRAWLDHNEPSWSPQRQEQMNRFLVDTAETRRKFGSGSVTSPHGAVKLRPVTWRESPIPDAQGSMLNSSGAAGPGEVFFFPVAPDVQLLMGIYTEVGLEQFSYYLADDPDLIDQLLERHTELAVSFIEHLPADNDIEALFFGDDLAFKTGPILSPAWFAEHYFHRLARITAACHTRNIKVLFHSDGNLNSILDGLVQAGIDGLNPIEVLAGMDIADIHRRHPHLFLAGGIDVSELLPGGTPQQVKDAVRRAIDAAEGRLMVGSTTELHDAVPLENYLALRQAVLECR